MTLALRAKELGLKGVRAVGDDDLALDAEAFASTANELFATHPLRVVRLWKATGHELAAALATPELARVTELHLSRNRLTDADVEALVHSANVGSVVRLELGFCGLSGRTGAILAKADPRRFGALRELSLFANKLGQLGVRALAGAKLLEHLTALDLEANHGGDEAIAALLAAPALRNMERLVIPRNEAGALAKQALAASKHPVRLTAVVGLQGAEVDTVVARNANTKLPWTAPAAPNEPLAHAPVKRESTPRDLSDTRGAELVAQLAASPRDPDLRAVYADWLQEQGDMRGELIAASGDPKRAERLRVRVEKDFKQRFKNKSALLEFDDGLIVSVGAQLRWFFEHGAAIFAREPVRRIYVQSPSADGMKRLPEIGGIERVRWICVTPPTPKLIQAIPWRTLPSLALELRVRGRELADYLVLPEIERLRRLDVILPTAEAIAVLESLPPLALEWLKVDALSDEWRARLEARFGATLVVEDERACVPDRG